VIVKDLLKLGKDQLATKNIAPVEAEILLAHVLGINRMELHGRVIELTKEQAAETAEIYNQAIAERLTGKPTQYIVGLAPFRYLEYEVGPGVLIPRPETESLVDEVLHQLNTFADPVSLVDLGSGTGAIAISIASETAGKKVVHVVAVEKSTEAIVWLQKNITKHDVSVRVIDEDVATALTGIKCDVVVANPPYLPDGAQIPQELNFEPTQALFGGPANGMAAPLIFIAAAARLLKPGGLLAIEHNELQGALIANELAEDFENIALHSDLTDRPRFTTARRKF
jgi:release factor glutamine methyltransferase